MATDTKELDIALGDTTTVSEDEAFRAYQYLQQAKQDPNLAASPNFQTDTNLLRSYVTERQKYGHDLFPNAIAAQNEQQTKYLKKLYTVPFEEAVPAEQLERLDKLAGMTGNPEAFKQRYANKEFLSAIVDQPLKAEQYEYVRNIYAKEHLGLDKVDDATFFTAKQSQIKEDETAENFLHEYSKQAFLDTLEGKPRTPIDLSTIPARLRVSFKEAADRSQREAARTIRRVNNDMKGALKEVDLITQNIRNREEIPTGAFVNLAAALPKEKGDRQIAISLISKRLAELPDTEKVGFARILDSIDKGILNATMSGSTYLAEGIGQGTQKILETVNKGSTTAKEMQQRADLRTDARTMRSLIIGETDPMKYATDSLPVQSLIAAGGSAWTIPAALAGPAGWGAMAASFAGDSYQAAREANPEAGSGSQYLAAAGSGMAQSAVETIFTKVGFKLLGSKLPVLAGLLNKTGIKNPIVRSVIGGAAKAGGVTAGEYTEEALQGATDRLSQDLALEFNNLAPTTDWGKFWGEWASVIPGGDAIGAEQRETLLAIAPFALVGAGAGSIGHFKYGQALTQNATILKAVGIPQARIEAIVGQTDVKKIDAEIKQAFEEGLEQTSKEQKAEVLNILRTAATLRQEAGVPVVIPETNSFTEETTYKFIDPLTREETAFETEEEALSKWNDYMNSTETAQLDSILAGSRSSTIDFLQDEGKAGEDVIVDEAEFAGKITRLVKMGLATQEQLDARIKLYVIQNGLSPEETVKAAEKLEVKAMAYQKEMRDGQLFYMVQLFKNADPLDIFEDFSESSFKKAMAEGLVNSKKILSDILEYQARTGDQLLPVDYDMDSDNKGGLIEAFSKLARAYVVGKTNTEALPQGTKNWINLYTAIAGFASAQTDQVVMDMKRAGILNKDIAAGNIDARTVDFIADSIGMNETEMFKRLEIKYQEQLAAEAMEGFPEIKDEAKGLLPHPETLKKNNNPLAGEVARIYESLKKPTRRRTKAGRQIDRTNEANAFFLPIGEMEDLDYVRRSLNEKGFNFLTPAEMVEALDISISYGKPVYGTMSADTTFSVGKARELDQQYLAAVEAGDMTTAQSMVDTAAKAAGYEIRAFHGTAEKFDRFDLKQGGKMTDAQSARRAVFLTDDEKTANSYAIYAAEAGPVKEAMRRAEAAEKKGDWNGYDEAIRQAEELDTYEASYKRREKSVIIDAYIAGDFLEFDAEGKTPQELNDEDIDAGITEQIKKAQRQGKTGVIYRNLDDAINLNDRPATHYAVFKPSQIKSAETVTRDESGNIIPLSQRFNPADERISFALSPTGLNRLENAIAAKMTAEPIERVEFYERVRNRLAAATQLMEDMEAGIGPFARKETDEVGQERRRIQDAIAEAKAIVNSLPREARGRITVDFTDIINQATEKGRINALMRLFDEADKALEFTLRANYMAAFAKLMDLAKPDLRQNKSLRGRLTPETQRKIAKIIPLISLSPLQANAELIAAKAHLEATENQEPDFTEDEDAMETWQAALAEAQERVDLIDTFGAISSHTSAELSQALEQLRSIYTTGRTARTILDQNKRQETASMKREVIDSIGGMPSPAKWAKRTADKGLQDYFESLLIGTASFHEVITYIFPNSPTVRLFQERIRSADRQFVRAKIDARKRFEDFMIQEFDLKGKLRKRKQNHILAELSTRRDDWEIEIAEGTRFETMKLTEEQAAAILEGTMKVGWETDRIAMGSLSQALADFRMQRDTVREEAAYFKTLSPEERAKAKEQGDTKPLVFSKKKIVFQRLVARGNPSAFIFSDMEAAYLLQLASQEQYLPALDKYGFTKEILEQVAAKLDPRAVKITRYLRKEYDAQYKRLNPVYQSLYGLDLPQIRNYAPARFVNMDSKAEDSMNPDGSTGAVNAMAAGFTKTRSHHMARPRQVNALGVYWDSLESTEYFIAWAEVMRDMRQVFRSPDVRRVVEANYGTRVANDFSRWLDILEVDGNLRSAQSQILQEATTNALASQSAIGIAYNLGTLFKQFSAATGQFMKLPPTQAIKGTYKALTDPNSLKMVWNSETIQQRILQGMNPEDKRLLDAANASPSDAIHLLALGRLPVSFMDGVLTTLAGAAAYKAHFDNANKLGLDDSVAHEISLKFMDEVVTSTAQPATTQDKSLMENTAKGFGKILFLFRSDPRQKFGSSLIAAALAKRGLITKTEAARRIFFRWAFYGFLGQLATDIWSSISRDDDEEDNWEIRDYMAAMLAGPISGLPLVGGGIEYVIRETVGTGGFANSANPIDKSIASIIQGKGSHTIEGIMEGDLGFKQILRDTQNYSQILGTYNPAFAIVPATIRLARDVEGIAENFIELFTDED